LLDATYVKVNFGSQVGEMAVWVAVGADEEGFRERLAVESAGGERREAWCELLRGLVDPGAFWGAVEGLRRPGGHPASGGQP
jgi:transposase-like protein